MDFASYISGFSDGEGCFSVSFNFREKLKTKIEVRPSFAIGQNKRSLDLLQQIQKFFDCGNIRFSKTDQIYKYEVRNIDELRKKVIPHFEKFPLMTAKLNDFQIFKQICESIAQMKHLNSQHLKVIIKLAFKMNGSGKRKYSEAELLNVLDKMKI
ncbi:MAG: LAGLIDADG homing endonuclease [Candidatus Moranbacteria bacterium GW2011_GWA2_39_41]|nr:MAG: LAGLIDADG homing endonuclease [Candidatus Moranbacteria bacterium GW2011_GWA2_39_41]